MLHLDMGRRETGKTTLAIYLARQTRQRLIFDPRNGIQPGANSVKVTRLAELVEHGLPMLLDDDVLEVIFTPAGNDLDHAFLVWSAHVKRWVQDTPARPLAVVIDECALVQGSLDKVAHPIQAALRWCPRERIHFYLTCHQPKDIPTRVRAIADYWILFHCNQETDLDVIESRCGEVVRREVQKLKPRQFLIWDDARGVLKRSPLQPYQWFVELGALRDPAAPPVVPVVALNPAAVDAGQLW